MTPTIHFGVVSQSNDVKLPDLAQIAAVLTKQQVQHFHPLWGRMGTMNAFDTMAHNPTGNLQAFVKDDIGQPGALGYHDTDEFGRPRIFAAAQGGDLNAVCKTLGHELCESVADPSGNRLVTMQDPDHPGETIQMLLEVCDPSEAANYKLDGFDCTDFYLQEWLDDVAVLHRRYSYMNIIPAPKIILPGGYCSFIKNGQWYQKTYWGAAPVIEGPFDWQRKPGESWRAMVDRHTRKRKVAA
jgi:hypothetical protein